MLLLCYCYVAAMLLLCCCYAAAMLLLCCFYVAAMLLLCCFYVAAMLLLCCCYAAAILLLCCCYVAAMLLLCCCYTAAMLLLCCCYVAAVLLLCAGGALRSGVSTRRKGTSTCTPTAATRVRHTQLATISCCRACTGPKSLVSCAPWWNACGNHLALSPSLPQPFSHTRFPTPALTDSLPPSASHSLPPCYVLYLRECGMCLTNLLSPCQSFWWLLVPGTRASDICL